MIVFSGIISEEIQLKTIKKRNHQFSCIAWISSTALIVLGGIVWILLDGDIKEFIILSVTLISALVLEQIGSYQVKKAIRWEYHIVIDAEGVKVECPLWKKPLQKPLSKIKKVLDEGDCFYIIYAGMSNCIVCQKDLLREGTIEEFKTLFAEKIVSKK